MTSHGCCDSYMRQPRSARASVDAPPGECQNTLSTLAFGNRAQCDSTWLSVPAHKETEHGSCHGRIERCFHVMRGASWQAAFRSSKLSFVLHLHSSRALLGNDQWLVSRGPRYDSDEAERSQDVPAEALTHRNRCAKSLGAPSLTPQRDHTGAQHL